MIIDLENEVDFSVSVTKLNNGFVEVAARIVGPCAQESISIGCPGNTLAQSVIVTNAGLESIQTLNVGSEKYDVLCKADAK